jgi:hypothetical protein
MENESWCGRGSGHVPRSHVGSGCANDADAPAKDANTTARGIHLLMVVTAGEDSLVQSTGGFTKRQSVNKSQRATRLPALLAVTESAITHVQLCGVFTTLLNSHSQPGGQMNPLGQTVLEHVGEV